MPHILLIDAKWDEVTKYLHSFREHLLTPHLRTHVVAALDEYKADQPNVDQHIKSNSVDYVSAAGHGLYDRFMGYSDSVIWKTGTNLSHFTGKIVHLLSCRTGAKLGPEIVAGGARAFWGYSENFRFLRSDPAPTPRHRDPVAALFIEMDCLIDYGILNSLTAAEIYEQVTEYVDRESASLDPFSSERAVLRHNYNHLVCPVTYGGQNETL